MISVQWLWLSEIGQFGKEFDLTEAPRDIIAGVLFFRIAEDALSLVVLYQVAHLAALIRLNGIKERGAI